MTNPSRPMPFRRAAAVASLGLIVLAAVPDRARAQTQPGVTDTSVKIGVFGPLSGNSMAYGFDVINAAKMTYDRVNREGGVHGRRIELVVEDDRCNANDLLAAVKKLVEQDQVFALNGGSCSGPVVGAREYVERAQIPLVMLNASGDGALYPPSRYIWGAFSISQHAVGGSMVQFAAEHLKAKKIGYVNHDDAYGGWNLEAAEFQARQTGTPLLVQSINPTITDVTAPMMKIRAANPDVLLIMTYARPVSLLIRKAHELGWNKPIVVAVNGTADLNQLVDNVGNRDALRNVYVQEVMVDVPGGPKLQWVYDQYRQAYPDLAARPGHPQTYMPYGVPSAMTVVNALRAAGRDLSRERFLDAISKTDFDSKVMAGPIQLTPQDHAAQKSAIYLKFDGQNRTLVPGSYRSAWTYAPK